MCYNLVHQLSALGYFNCKEEPIGTYLLKLKKMNNDSICDEEELLPTLE